LAHGYPLTGPLFRVGAHNHQEVSGLMALDPRIRAELERRGPANVRELLRTGAGFGAHANVAVQLEGVSDPLRGDVEEWLAGKEREGEAVARDTLKWARVAGALPSLAFLSPLLSGSQVSSSGFAVVPIIALIMPNNIALMSEISEHQYS
jgi:hypothetical protein